jgi:hypothetical protein
MTEESIIESIIELDICKKTKSEEEADDFLNQVSLDFLINKKQYKNHSTSFTENTINKKINKKDKKFYRRRILSLTKDLLSKETEVEAEVEIPPDIKYIFDNFIKACVHYFKILDRNDIIQQDYNEFKDKIKENNKINDESHKILKEENEKLLMRSVKMSNPSLDNFIKINMTKQSKELIIPQQKEINLKDPILKNKGIDKKKNIINNYEEDTKKQTNKIQKDEK